MLKPNEKFADSIADASAAEYVDWNHVPDVRKLAVPHQLVRVRHTGQPIPNPQVLVDRYGQGHTFQPGQTKELDLLVSQIERLRELRRPGRMIDAMVQEGEIYQMKRVEAPLHPLIIEDLSQP